MMNGHRGQVITVKGDKSDIKPNIYFENRHFW